MKSTPAFALTLVLSVFALTVTNSTAAAALTPAADAKAAEVAANMKKNDVRTKTVVVDNKHGYPCLPDGKYLEVRLQVRKALAYDWNKKRIQYGWEDAKTIVVDQSGGVMEVCAE
jgi:hypothetical protein